MWCGVDRQGVLVATATIIICWGGSCDGRAGTVSDIDLPAGRMGAASGRMGKMLPGGCFHRDVQGTRRDALKPGTVSGSGRGETRTLRSAGERGK